MPVSQGVIDAARPIAVEFIKRKESLRLAAYLDGAGIPTIGWGHIKGVRLGDRCTTTQALAWADADVDEHAAVVEACLTREPSVHQLAAMISLAFNIGAGWIGSMKPVNAKDGFRQSSVLRLFNAGKDAEAAKAFELWRKETVKGVKVDSNGLWTRRKEEAALYLTPDNAVRPPVLEIPDEPYAAPEAPALVPQSVDPAPIASPIEKVGGMVVSGGGISGGIAVVSGAADKGAITLAVLFAGIVVLIIVAAAAWWILRGRRNG